MSECPNCERQKQRVELWRQEAYRLSERQWVGLTDEEIWTVLQFRGYNTDTIEIAKAIETKLKEKNT
jgi:hypothetical protein